MKRFNLKIRKIAFASLLALASPAYLLPAQVTTITTVDEDQFLQQLTDRIIALCQVAQDAFAKFTDANNQEGYSIHVNRFANAIARFREEIIRPILDRLATAHDENTKRALIIAQEIVNDMINQLATFHAVLAKHINSTNAIALKNDLEPVIANITSQALYQKAVQKLSDLEVSINALGHTSFAHKINEMKTLVTKAYNNYHATKGQDRNKAFQLLMRRLKKK